MRAATGVKSSPKLASAGEHDLIHLGRRLDSPKGRHVDGALEVLQQHDVHRVHHHIHQVRGEQRDGEGEDLAPRDGNGLEVEVLEQVLVA
jgi:hypothetical protein